VVRRDLILTVLVDVPVDSPAYREELFGPVAALIRARDIDDAIRIANGTRFGLGASAWTSEGAEARRFATDLQAAVCSSMRWSPRIRASLWWREGQRLRES
jgi:acyl-CoA reductase-like NAD-dependent aldehyde dehydrogenase